MKFLAGTTYIDCPQCDDGQIAVTGRLYSDRAVDYIEPEPCFDCGFEIAADDLADDIQESIAEAAVDEWKEHYRGI